MGYRHEEVKPYRDTEDKRSQIEEMFDNIAPEYDKYNYIVSMNLDRIWRRRAILSLKAYHPSNILDIATGTGDLAILINKILAPESITGCDISEGMMRVAKKKCEKRGMTNIKFEKEDCTSLSYPDNSFDAVTSSFGIRNFQHLDRALGEICRVLRPGGHLVILELSSPSRFPMKQLFPIYAKYIMPQLGYMFSNDKKAYQYLPDSIAAFPQGEQMKEILEKIGFKNVTFRRFAGGVCTFYLAEK